MMFLTSLHRKLWQFPSSRLQRRSAVKCKAARPRLEPLEDRLLLSTYFVTNTKDSGKDSLRQAILNVDNGSGGDTIAFKIGRGGVQTIQLLSSLPAITQSVTIDGTTQPGYSGKPLIELDGANAGSSANGLTINAGNSTVKGLVINRFSGDGILLQGQGSDLVVGNYIGTDVTGSQALGNGGNGVEVSQISNITIGGTTAGARNLISGNQATGVLLFGGTDNVVEGNLIGTDVTGTKALGNLNSGVDLESETNDTIGGITPGARNLISGNQGNGITGAAPAVGGGYLIEGNYIGTDVTGTQALGNGSNGIELGGVSNSMIGGTMAGAGNLISGNQFSAIYLSRGSNNVVQGNIIGTDVTGTEALGNGSGPFIQSQDSGTIGGTVSGAGNLISGNLVFGILLNGVGNLLVQGNTIGTDITGTKALGDGNFGIEMYGATNTTIGGTTAGARNLISGNQGDGILMAQFISGSVVEGNYIGTDATGTKALGNAANGVEITGGSSQNTVGGTVAGAGNLISGNGQNGVLLDQSPSGAQVGGNFVQGNLIGTNATGTGALGNGANGVEISGIGNQQFEGSIIGGSTSGAGNVISGNKANGIPISEYTQNLIQGNLIGTDITGTAALGNGGDGIDDSGGTFDTIGGTAVGAANLVSGNSGDGISLNPDANGFTPDFNVIQGNSIGTDITGVRSLGNGGNGVDINHGSGNTIGGTAAGAGNTIAFSGNDGVLVDTRTGNGILSDQIFSSGHLGIELVNNGNNNQAAPQLSKAIQSGSNTLIVGKLYSTPNTTFTLQFFSDPSPDPSGLGEGQQLLGTFTVTTNAAGIAPFSITIPTLVPAGQIITATATDPNNNTSEFSLPVKVMGGGNEVQTAVYEQQPLGVLAPSGGGGNMNLRYSPTGSPSQPSAAAAVNALLGPALGKKRLGQLIWANEST
jgi:titin